MAQQLGGVGHGGDRRRMKPHHTPLSSHPKNMGWLGVPEREKLPSPSKLLNFISCTGLLCHVSPLHGIRRYYRSDPWEVLGEMSYGAKPEELSLFSLLKRRSRGDLIVLCEVPSRGDKSRY